MTIYFWKEGKPGPVSRGFKKTALHRKARRSVSAASLRTLEALWVAIRYFYCLNRSHPSQRFRKVPRGWWVAR